MTEYITPTTWEQCAAHVEAGGVVEIEDAPGVWINDRAAATTYRGRCGTPDDGWAPRRLVPGESAPAPESSTGIGEGEAVRAYYRPTAERLRAISEVMTAERLRDEAAAPAAGDDLRDAVHLLDLAWGVIANADGWDGDTSWRQAAERWRDGYHRLLDDIRTTAPTPPPVPPWPDGVLRDAANRLRWIANSGYIEDPGIKRIIRSWADELDATLVPPWTGAVLSGLTDEDGVPTWLAQAGQVRGEMVRDTRGAVWTPCALDDNLHPQAWVEVRAPRPVAEVHMSPDEARALAAALVHYANEATP